MSLERCKGCQDLSSQEMSRFRHIEDVYRDVSHKWGYSEVRTPTLEYLHLFTASGTLTPGMLKRVYSFLDWDGWSGERVVLRPDGTIPAVRVYVDEAKDKALARYSYVVNTFIFEETGSKSRERWQLGAELIGSNSAAADVELVAMAVDVLKALGLGEVEISLSHAGIVKSLLASLEITPAEQVKLFDRLLDGDAEVLKRLKPELAKTLTMLLDMKGKSSGFLKNMKALAGKGAAGFEESLADFIKTADLLEKNGIGYRIDLASGKGFEYYTGIIFRLFVNNVNVGGGGRYDALVPLMGGPNTPAAGFALYCDQLMKLTASNAEEKATAVLVNFAEEEASAAFEAASRLRQAGFIAAMGLTKSAKGFDWTLAVKAGGYDITNLASKEKCTAASIEEAVNIIGGKNVAKDSLA